jgi:N-acetylneuraminic acid mutarotase
VYKFNPLDNTWGQFNTFPIMGGTDVRLMGEVVCKDTFYLISGYSESYYIAAFDEENSRWNQYLFHHGDPSNTPGVAFSLNDKIYFGLNYYYSSNWFWECEPINNYKWTRKGDFPGTPPGHFSTYFSLENKGYVVFANNEVWQFNPDSLIWIRKADFPGKARESAISFVLNGFAYMGTGRDEETSSLNDIWKYDHVSDIWTLVSNMPVGRYSAVAFSVNNKAYIGFGMVIQDYYPTDLFDFYEFDPNYPLK